MNLDYEDKVQLGVAPLVQEQQILDEDWEKYYSFDHVEKSKIDNDVEDY
jgi:hypothetical protein